MRNIRLIARLDVKAPNLIKSVQLEGFANSETPMSSHYDTINRA